MQLIERTTHQGYPLYQLEYNRARVSVLSVHYYESRGHAGPGTWPKPCSRMKHSLQIDSHCRFIPHWDHEMIAMLDSLRAESPKPILSSYPPAYEPGENEIRKIMSAA